MELRTYSDKDMKDYARAAIEADRKRRGEPVKSHLKVSYDEKGDCLYVVCDSNEPADAEEDDKGILYRRAISDGRLVGITIMNFMGPHAQRPAEPVKVPSAWSKGTRYQVEPHGDGYAIYRGRDQSHHGLNLAHLTECTEEFAKQIEAALNGPAHGTHPTP